MDAIEEAIYINIQTHTSNINKYLLYLKQVGSEKTNEVTFDQFKQLMDAIEEAMDEEDDEDYEAPPSKGMCVCCYVYVFIYIYIYLYIFICSWIKKLMYMIEDINICIYIYVYMCMDEEDDEDYEAPPSKGI
jgi:hypothetical protein